MENTVNWLRKGRGGGEEERAGYSQLPEIHDEYASTSTAGNSDGYHGGNNNNASSSSSSSSVSQKKGVKSTGKQLSAILRKNLTLKMKSRRSACGCTVGGIPGLIFELFLPSLLILLLSIPKIFLNPIQFPTLRVPEADTFKLQSAEWLQKGCPNTTVTAYCASPIWQQQWDDGNVLFTPNTTLETSVIETIVKDISCPKATTKEQVAFFYIFWKKLIDSGVEPPMTCAASHEYCLSEPTCWEPLRDWLFTGFSTEDEAMEFAMNSKNRTRAMINFRDLERGDTSMKYTLRMNHTMTPNTVELNDVFALNPQMKTTYYRHYWFFTNLQLSIDKALIGNSKKNNPEKLPADIDVQVHQFPAPPYSLNPDAIIAGSFMDICLVVAFLMPMRSNVASVVSEKELRLREGMRLLGVTDFSYWISWVLTHGTEQTIISLCMSLVATIVFPESDWHATFTVYAFLSFSLIPLAYVVSCFFQRTATAGPSVVLIFVCLMIPGMLAPVMQPYGGYAYKYASYLSPSNIALAGTILRRLEFSGIGLTWDTFSVPVIIDGSLSAASLCANLFRNMIIYTVVFLYLDKVLPDEAGRRLPFYFPFSKRFWVEWLQRASNDGEDPRQLQQNKVELASSTSLHIINLLKEFKSIGGTKVVAVNNLNLEAVSSEVFGLLGHNGAGKTTTMSIITGMLYPSSGNVYVGKHSVLTEMDIIRKSLGLCPQFDILWPTMTVRDHLTFYAKIKGVPKHEIRTCVEGMAQEVGLSEKLNCPSCELSGGQMRKLSVGIAFMGNPKLVVLDEPTSGMDPRSRRDTWEIIRKNRKDKVILLSTHFMEEADILCDKIGIMHRGKLATCGSSLELKEEFGAGYVLTIILKDSEGGDKETNEQSVNGSVLEKVKVIVPDAQVGSGAGSELSIRIDKKYTDVFPELTEECEKLQQDGAIKSYGLSFTTLEDVFLKVVEDCEKDAESSHVVNMSSDSPSSNNSSSGKKKKKVKPGDLPFYEVSVNKNGSNYVQRVNSYGMMTKHKGKKLLYQQFKAMLWKKYLCTSRERVKLIVQLLVPLLLLLASLTAGKASGKFPTYPARVLSRESIFENKQVIFGTSVEMQQNQTDLNAFKTSYGKSSILSIGASGETELDNFALDTWYGGAYRFDTLHLESYDTQSLAANGTISVNFTNLHALPTALNAFTSAISRGSNGRDIEAVNRPLPVLASEDIVKAYEFVFKFIFICCLLMAVSSLSASFSMFIVAEKANKSKQVQMVSGVHKGVFWSSHFICDLAVYIVPSSVMIVCFNFYNCQEFLGANLFPVILVFFAYGCASLPAIYALHFMFEEAFKAFLRSWTICFLSGYICFLVDWIFGLIAWLSRTCRIIHKVVTWVFPVISPQFNIAKAMYNLQLNENDPLDPLAVPRSPWHLSITGWPIIFMFIQMVLFSLLVLAIEVNIWAKFRAWGKALYQYDNFEPDPSNESLVLVKDLHKKYAPFLPAAVDKIDFEVGKNECFGLLGVNSAGKTTTFKMVTGEIMPTSGHALIAGHDIVTDTHSARLFMGYCPQFEAVIGNMTGREMLKMYAMIRGIPSKFIGKEVERIITKLDLPMYANKLSGTYSGGNKRKLAVAAAIVGDPKVVLLDEPSTGMDPVAKRFLWNVISDMYSNEDKSVILTSHSMAECEALCSRIGIMVAGRFRCMGKIQEIKNDFGGGYHVEFRFTDSKQFQALRTFMRATCPTATEIESTDLYCLYQISQSDAHLPTLFKLINQMKEEIGFEAFSVSQTSLEQVFIKFANDEA